MSIFIFGFLFLDFSDFISSAFDLNGTLWLATDLRQNRRQQNAFQLIFVII